MVLNRLGLGLLLIGLTSALLLFSDSNQKKTRTEVARVAVFQFATRPLMDECVAGILDGLRVEGFTDGQEMKVEKFNAENDLPTANTIARLIVSRNYDLVITASTPCMQILAGVNQKGAVRHVFCAVTDPFGAGVGISRENPTDHPRHMAGIGTFQPVEATFRIAKQLYPGLKRVGEAWNPAEACSEACTLKARAICQELGIELMEAHVDSSSGVREAVASLAARGAQAIWIGGDNTVEIAVDSVVEVARKANVPVFANSPANLDRGLLFALGADYVEVGKTAGILSGKILKGLDPASVPIKDVMPHRLALNLRSMKGLRDPWRVPPDLPVKAADVIDENGVVLR
ncbi:MAG: ABC transporter substrate-binding protein [Acidobacteriota bacterium]